MKKPIILVHNVATNEAIEREMTDEEFAIYEADQEKIKIEYEKQLAKENARESALAKLAALGLTPEEIAAL